MAKSVDKPRSACDWCRHRISSRGALSRLDRRDHRPGHGRGHISWAIRLGMEILFASYSLSSSASLPENIPGISKKRDRLVIVVSPTVRHVVQGHRAQLPANRAHHRRSWHNILLYAASIEPSADPDIVHVERAGRSRRVIPKRGIEKTGLDKVTSATSDHGNSFWRPNFASESNSQTVAIRLSENCRSAKT